MPDFTGSELPYVQTFDETQRLYKVTGRIPVVLSNLAKGMVLDTLKAKRQEVAVVGGLQAQLRGFTYKAYITKDFLNLIPQYNIPSE